MRETVFGLTGLFHLLAVPFGLFLFFWEWNLRGLVSAAIGAILFLAMRKTVFEDVHRTLFVVRWTLLLSGLLWTLLPWIQQLLTEVRTQPEWPVSAWLACGVAFSMGLLDFYGARAAQAPLVQRRTHVGVDDVTLQNADGEAVELRSILDAPALFILFRGPWCPFCVHHLQAFQEALPEFQSFGLRIAAITTAPPHELKEFAQAYPAALSFYSDPHEGLAGRFANTRNLPRLSDVLRGQSEGKAIYVPTVLLVTPEGEVIYAKQTEHLYSREEPRVALQAYKDYLYESRLKDIVSEKTHEARLLARQKAAVLRVMSHDLAGSLSVVSFAARRGLMQERSEADLSLWQRVKRAADNQERVIRNARTIEAVSSGKLKLETDVLSSNSLREHLEFVFAEPLESKGLKLLVEEDNGREHSLLPLVNEGSFFVQVMENLISNAIKFSPAHAEAEIRVSVGVVEDGQRAYIRVEDEGCGIPDEKVRRLFDFEQETTSLGSQGEKGTGFGMPTVKIFVEAMGGTIEVQRRKVKGTAITLFFPAASTRSQSVDPESRAS